MADDDRNEWRSSGKLAEQARAPAAYQTETHLSQVGTFTGHSVKV